MWLPRASNWLFSGIFGWCWRGWEVGGWLSGGGVVAVVATKKGVVVDDVIGEVLGPGVAYVADELVEG